MPWAEGLSRWPLQFEAWAIDVLQHTRSISDGSLPLRLGWDACDRIMKRGVERGLQRLVTVQVRLVGIDEKSFGKIHDYIAMMNDLQEARVLEVVEGAGAKEIEAFWETLPDELRERWRPWPWTGAKP